MHEFGSALRAEYFQSTADCKEFGNLDSLIIYRLNAGQRTENGGQMEIYFIFQEDLLSQQLTLRKHMEEILPLTVEMVRRGVYSLSKRVAGRKLIADPL